MMPKTMITCAVTGNLTKPRRSPHCRVWWGAMVLARAVDDRKFSDEILAAAVTAFGGQPDSGRMRRLSRRRPDRFPP